MTSIGKMLRAAAFGLAIIAAAAVPTKKAHADGGAVVAGIAGGLILGSILGSAANANNGYYYNNGYATQPYYAPAPTYYAPAPRYYAPPVTLSFGYHSGRHYGHRRHYRGGRHYGSRRHYRRHHRGHRGYHRGHRGHHRY